MQAQIVREKYLVVNKDGVIEKKGQAGFLYADDVCLMASNEQDMQMIFDNISGLWYES